MLLLHHSGYGSQYLSKDVLRLLADQGITCSMSRKGGATQLKIERVQRRHYVTRDEVQADVFDYIERFCNPQRRLRP